MRKLIVQVDNVFAVIAGVITLIVGLFSCYEAIARGVFDSPTMWTMDISRYMIIWAIFLGSASAFLTKTHIAVDFIREAAGQRFGRGLRRVLCVAGYLMALIYVSVLGWKSVTQAMEAVAGGKLTYGMLMIPSVYLYLAMIVGSVLMFVTLIYIIGDLLKKGDDYL